MDKFMLDERKVKILFSTPYGQTLGDWNHRLKRQAEIMSKYCDLKVFGRHITKDSGMGNTFLCELKKEIRDFRPDVIYVNGFRIAYECLRIFNKVVYDMGSWKTRNILIDSYNITYDDMRKMTVGQIIDKVNRRSGAMDYKKEDWVIKNAKAIIVWESEEAEFIKKVHKVDVNQISMMFYDTPKPIPWEQKEDKVIAIAAKWGENSKNHRLINNINRDLEGKYHIHSIGHAGNGEKFVNHKDLMDMVNKSKVVFCPYFCGGIGVINEGLKLGCNVIVGDWHPFPDFPEHTVGLLSYFRNCYDVIY